MKQGFGIAFTTLSWWVCVLTGKYIQESIQYYVLIPFVILSIAVHWKYYREKSSRFLLFYLSGVCLGLLFDGTLVSLKILEATGNNMFPLWLLCLWLVFPLNFLHTLKTFTESKKMPLAGLFGLIGGPLAYKAGPAFGILLLNGLWWLAEGFFWAFYMILMGYLYRTWKP